MPSIDLEVAKKEALDDLIEIVEGITSRQKAFALTNAATGTDLTHGWGAALGLAASAYVLEVRAYEGTAAALGGLIGGLSVQKTTANLATLIFADEEAVISEAVVILTIIPL